jgi:TAK1-binding protein 1
LLSFLGIGTAVNTVYQEDGQRQEEHPFEDENIHLRYSDSVVLYGVFDGHDGVQVAKAAKDQITAEILLGDLKENLSDEEVRRILK